MEKLHIDSDVVKAFNESAKSDVSAALTLLSSPGHPHSPINAICNFWFAVEKIVRLNLYLRSPLLLKKNPNADDLISHIQPGRQKFGTDYVLGLKDSAVSFHASWERLKVFLPKLSELDLYKGEIARIRNEHAHCFCLKPHSLALTKAQLDVWKILDSVCAGLEYVHKGAYKTTLESLCPNKASYIKAQAAIRTFDLKRLFTDVKQKNFVLIKARKILNYEDFSKFGGVIAEHTVEVDCPVCAASKGTVGFSLDWDFPLDRECDELIWEDPCQYYASFENFACTNCGTYIESRSILADLKYDTGELSPDLMISWDINDHVTGVERYVHGRYKDPFEGSPVEWVD